MTFAVYEATFAFFGYTSSSLAFLLFYDPKRSGPTQLILQLEQ